MSIGAVLFIQWRHCKTTCPKLCYFFLGIILNIVVPQFGQVPFIAARSTPPLPLKVTSLGSFIILLALHLTQYASTCAINFISARHDGRTILIITLSTV